MWNQKAIGYRQVRLLEALHVFITDPVQSKLLYNMVGIVLVKVIYVAVKQLKQLWKKPRKKF